jgi:hypothetical protein
MTYGADAMLEWSDRSGNYSVFILLLLSKALIFAENNDVSSDLGKTYLEKGLYYDHRSDFDEALK